jgi:hypothetical protein
MPHTQGRHPGESRDPSVVDAKPSQAASKMRLQPSLFLVRVSLIIQAKDVIPANAGTQGKVDAMLSPPQ